MDKLDLDNFDTLDYTTLPPTLETATLLNTSIDSCLELLSIEPLLISYIEKPTTEMCILALKQNFDGIILIIRQRFPHIFQNRTDFSIVNQLKYF